MNVLKEQGSWINVDSVECILVVLLEWLSIDQTRDRPILLKLQDKVSSVILGLKLLYLILKSIRFIFIVLKP